MMITVPARIALVLVVLGLIAVIGGAGAITTKSGCMSHAIEKRWASANWLGLGVGFCIQGE